MNSISEEKPHASDLREQKLSSTSLVELNVENIARHFPPRPSDSHKGTWGHVGIIAGSRGRSGAAILAARGALRIGAGLVTVVTDEATAQIVDSVSVESMSLHLELTSANVSALREECARFDSIVIGPGLGDDQHAAIRELIAQLDQPIVVDATALNAFAGSPDALRRKFPTVLTPHPGELARLLGKTNSHIQENRVNSARQTASITGAVTLLKGNRTLVATPAGEVSINLTGNPGMATGGMGDVLAGMIGALLARGLDARDAAEAAAFVHGLAGDLLAQTIDYGFTASELADRIPVAVRSLRSDR